MIVNLVGNAIKFTERGEVRGAGRDRRRTAEDEVALALRRSADTGIGIPPDKQQRHLRGRSRRPTLDHAALRRHRAGPGDLRAAGRADGRPHLGRERAGPGQPLPLHRALRPAGDGRRPTAAAAGEAARPARAGRRRQRHEPPHPRGDADPLADAADHGRRRAGGAGRAGAGGARWASRIRWCCSTRRCRRWTASRWPSRSSGVPGSPAPSIMMLTSAARPGDRARCRELGYRALPDQAVKQSDLLDAIMGALGGRAPAKTRPLAGAARPEAGAAAARAAGRGQRRQPAAGGAACSRRRATASMVASNGREALALLEQRVVRPRADGRADAGDGRLRGHRRHPRAREGRQAATCRSSP